MIIKNGQVFNSNGRFIPADVELAGDRIVKVAPAGTLHGDEELDAAGKYVTPGFVDIHIHGAAGSDFCDGMDGSDKYVRAMQKYLGSQGVTSFWAPPWPSARKFWTASLIPPGPSSARRATARFCGA